MTLQINIYGQTYDDEIPAFIKIDDMYFNTLSKQMSTVESLDAYAESIEYEWPDGERGDLTKELAEQFGFPWSDDESDGGGEDTVNGGGEDTVNGGGEDTVNGAGEDTVDGGAGEDTVNGGEDTVDGGEDTVDGGAGEDTVTG